MLGSTELCPNLLAFIGMMERQGYEARDMATVFLTKIHKLATKNAHRYVARDAASGDLLPARCLQMPLDNVLWAHTSAPHLWQREIIQDCRMEPVVRTGERVLRNEEIQAFVVIIVFVVFFHFVFVFGF